MKAKIGLFTKKSRIILFFTKGIRKLGLIGPGERLLFRKHRNKLRIFKNWCFLRFFFKKIVDYLHDVTKKAEWDLLFYNGQTMETLSKTYFVTHQVFFSKNSLILFFFNKKINFS